MISSLDRYRITTQGKVEAFVLSFFITILGLAVPIVTLQVYDRLLKNHSVETATVLIIGAAVAIALESFLRYGRSYLLSRYSVGFEVAAEKHFMRKFINLTRNHRSSHGPALISQNQSDLALLKNHYSGQTVIALFDLPFSLLYLFIIWYVGGVIVLVPLVLMVVVLLLTIYFRRIASPAIALRDRDQVTLIEQLYTIFIQGRRTKFDVDSSIESCSRVSKKARGSRMVVATLNLFATDTVMGLSQLVTIGIVIFGAILVIHGKMSTGGLAALTILAGRSIGPVTRLIAYNIGLESLEAATERIAKVDALQEVAIFKEHGVLPEIREVSCSIEEMVMKNNQEYHLSLNLTAGSRILLSSEDEYCNSLLFDSLLGERNSQVAIGGYRLSEYSRDSYFRQVAYITSSSILFPGTILENLSNFQEEFQAYALELAEEFGILSIIKRLPYGVKTVISSVDYPPLGQGVVQLIAIIRALVVTPQLLILRGGDNGLDIPHKEKLVTYLQEQKSLMVLAENVSPEIQQILTPLKISEYCTEAIHG